MRRYVKLSLALTLATTLIVGCGNNITRDVPKKSGKISEQNPLISGPKQGEISQNPQPFQPLEPTPHAPVFSDVDYNGNNSSSNLDDNLSAPGTDTNSSSAVNNSSDINSSKSIDVYKTINGTYSISITAQKDTMQSGDTQNIHYEIKNFFTKKPADDRAVKNLKFTIDKKYAEFFDANGNHGNVIEFGKNSSSAPAVGDIAIKTNSVSGQVRVNIEADIDGSQIRLTKTLPITIEKNRSSSMAIVPYATSYKDGLYTTKFVIHVVDSYGNKAKDGTKIQTGVINNPKLYSRAYDGDTLPTDPYGNVTYFYMTYDRFTTKDEDNKTVYGETNYKPFYTWKNIDLRAELQRSGGKFILPTNTPIPSSVDSQDTLIILGNKEQNKPENLGGWDIKDVGTNSLTLYDLEGSKDTKNVSFVIGNDYRYDECIESNANGASSTFTSSDVKDGVAYAELRYTPSMVGKDIFIYANSKIDGKRIGISRKVVLTGTGVSEGTFSCKNENKKDSGLLISCSQSVVITLNDSNKLARRVYLPQPTSKFVNYIASSITRTDCNGRATISIYGVKPGETATVNYGGHVMMHEAIINQK